MIMTTNVCSTRQVNMDSLGAPSLSRVLFKESNRAVENEYNDVFKAIILT